VHRLLEPQWQVTALDHLDIYANEPGLAARGLSALTTDVFLLDRSA
jgi:hypothetical protein